MNEIFKEGVPGKNLKLSLLKLFNTIKDGGHIPEFMQSADVYFYFFLLLDIFQNHKHLQRYKYTKILTEHN